MDKEEKRQFLIELSKWLNESMSGTKRAVYGTDENGEEIDVKGFSKIISAGFSIGAMTGQGYSFPEEDKINIMLSKNMVGTIELVTNDNAGLMLRLHHTDKEEFSEDVFVSNPDSFERTLEVIEGWPITSFKFGIDSWKR